MLMTTYAVGELSALNGVMGAKAERSCVFHLVGMPTMRNQRVGKIIHHTLGDGVFQNFANISAQAACVSAVITPDNCVHEMERLIATARAESRPAYILVASDYAITPVAASAATPYPKPASGPTSPRPPRQSPSGFKPREPWPCSPLTQSRGSSSSEAYWRSSRRSAAPSL
jgi:indolepyruvate decarboxylase